jgi:hypothetical protein
MVLLATAQSSVEAHRSSLFGIMSPLTRVYKRDVRGPFTEWNGADESTGALKFPKLVAGGTRSEKMKFGQPIKMAKKNMAYEPSFRLR